MTRKEIFDITNNFINNSEFKNVIGGNDTKSTIGINQFRSIASACRSAECYDEIELLIKYNTAKDDNHNWIKIKDKLVESMRKVKMNDEKNVLENLNLFFGYLYRYGRIEAANKKNKKESPHNKNSGSNNYNNWKR